MQAIHDLIPTTISKDSTSNGFIWIIDVSIGLGIGKILTVLALDAHHHKQEAKSPGLRDVHCIGVSVAPSWTGEHIADFLKKIIATQGCPAAFLKDGGTDLGKAVRLLNEQALPCLCIDDISHKIANLVKHEYKNHPLFDTFITACGKVSKNLKQTLLACLAPPKVSVKARFMNLHRLVSWADKILKHSPSGRAAEGSLLSKLRASLDDLPQCKAFIARFIRDVKPLMECQKIIKSKGLNHETYNQCKKFLEAIPATSSIYIGFHVWAKEHLTIAPQIVSDGVGLTISTDQIESLFGVGKHHGTGEIKDANRISMRLPALCGTFTREDAEKVSNITVKQHKEAMGKASSVIKQRQQVLSNPGELETLSDYQGKHFFELIPSPKKQSNDGKDDCNISLLSDSSRLPDIPLNTAVPAPEMVTAMSATSI